MDTAAWVRTFLVSRPISSIAKRAVHRGRTHLRVTKLEDREVPAQLAMAGNVEPLTAVGRSMVFVADDLRGRVPLAELAGSEVVAIRSDGDAIAQISAALAGRRELDCIRIVSHGAAGQIALGKGGIDSATLQSRSAEIQAWSRSLAPGADILVYGCNVASSPVGKAFVQSLATLTGADVAASTNVTGRGGDTTLEFSSGIMEHSTSAEAMTWNSSLLLPNERAGSYAPFSGVAARNDYAFAALKSDGSLSAWGNSLYGGTGAPTGTNFTRIFSNAASFAALKTDGSISAWGNGSNGGTGAPTGTGFTTVSSTQNAFAALRSDGSISAWGNPLNGGTGSPTGAGFAAIFSNSSAFAALKTDGSIVAWGPSGYGGTGAPTGTGFTSILSTGFAFAAIRANGSITVWGDSSYGGSGAPTGTGFTDVFSNYTAFAALKSDGSITAWGLSGFGGTGAPTGAGYTDVFSTYGAFAAFKSDGSITAWGDSGYGGAGAPAGTGFTQVFSNSFAFAALKPDGSITAWGHPIYGGTGAPTGTGFTKIVSTYSSFAALRNDSSITAWGESATGGTGAPTGGGYVQLFSNNNAVAAIKSDSSIVSWGGSAYGGTGAPAGVGFRTIQSIKNFQPYVEPQQSGGFAASVGYSFTQPIRVVSLESPVFSITSGSLATGLSLNSSTGIVSGTPATGSAGIYNITVTASNSVGSASQRVQMQVFGSLLPNQRTGSSNSFTGVASVNAYAFAGLKADGSIVAWGDPTYGASGVPLSNGFIQIFSTNGSFAAIRSDGSIVAWGNPSGGGTGAPTGTGFTTIASSNLAFAALKSDGSIVAWGPSVYGGTNAPTGNGFTQIFSTSFAFAGLKADGSITAWGSASGGGTGAPTGIGFGRIFSANSAFAALKDDGSIVAWGDPGNGGTGAPTGSGFTQVFSTGSSFAALKADGSITAWGSTTSGGTGVPTGTGFTQLFSTNSAFAAQKADGSITAWGSGPNGGTGAPTGSGFTQVFSTASAFAALRTDGSIAVWGGTLETTWAPTGSGFTQVFSTASAFAALKADGSVISWGNSSYGGFGAPIGTGLRTIHSAKDFAPYFEPGLPTAYSVAMGLPFSARVRAVSLDFLTYRIESGSLPAGLTLNTLTGTISGTVPPSAAGTFNVAIAASNGMSPDAIQNITIQTTGSNLVYVDDDWAGLASGTVIPDADPLTVGNQPATIGTTAFATIPPAIASLLPDGSAALMLLPGIYSSAVAMDRPFNWMVTGSSTVSGAISGSQSLGKQGPGTLILSGSNTYSGGTTINSGTLQLGNGGTMGSIIGNVTNNATLAFSRSDNFTFGGVVSGSGNVVKSGNGSLTLAASNSYTGGTIVSRGNLFWGADSQLGANNGSVSVGQLGKVVVTSPLTTSREITLASSVLQVNSGITLTVDNATIGGGQLAGPGTIATTGAGSTFFTGTSTSVNAVLQANGSDSFANFSNSGSMSLASGKTFSLSSFSNDAAGRLSVVGTANTSDFSTIGTLTVSGSLLNTGTSGLVFGGGSISTINAGGTINIGSVNASVAGGLVINNGSFGSATNTIILDYGARVKGTGTFGGVTTQNGGIYAPGASPGTASTNQFNVNGGGTMELEISNATGAAGSLSGWDLTMIQPNIFSPSSANIAFTAATDNKYTILLSSRLDSGDRNSPGAASNFNPTQSYAWKFADASNAATTVSGTFSPAAFNINTTGFTNAFTGAFSVELRDGGKNLYLVYTAPPAIAQVKVNDGSIQRSIVKSVTVTFNSVVNFAGSVASAFQLSRQGGGNVGGFSATANTVNSVTVVTLSNFTGAQTQFGSLANGFYTLTVLASQVSNAGGAMASNYTLVGNSTNKFFRYYGDLDGNASVDGDDLAIFVSTLFNPNNYVAALDYDNNGSIDGDDLALFVQNLFVPL